MSEQRGPQRGMVLGRPGEPGYAGLVTFARVPLVLDPGVLRGVDVAIVGAPLDEAVSYRPGARFGPRAIRQADLGGAAWRPNMDLGVNPFQVLTVVDYGDVEVTPGDAARSHERIRHAVQEVRDAGAVPIVLGGDHSLAHPDIGAVAESLKPRSLGVVHFDAHADNAPSLYGVTRSHGTPMRLLVEEGSARQAHRPGPTTRTSRRSWRTARCSRPCQAWPSGSWGGSRAPNARDRARPLTPRVRRRTPRRPPRTVPRPRRCAGRTASTAPHRPGS